MARHPALALLRVGDRLEAIRYLEECGDCPGALALLRAGSFDDYAVAVLEGLDRGAGHEPQRADDKARHGPGGMA